jgi:hypothetical protein
MSDEDSSDPKVLLETKCRESDKCRPFWLELVKCERRVTKHPVREETCVQELFDLQPCIDQCVASRLFKYLK